MCAGWANLIIKFWPFYVIARMRHLYKFTMYPSLIVAMEPGKRHALRAHIPEAGTDWLNPLSLGTMSASAYIENLA